MPTAKKKTPPWERPNPNANERTRSSTSAQKSNAKAGAQRAGRRYPNLVDNIERREEEARERHIMTTKRKPRTEAPHGGLTAAGRAEFRRRDGARRKPGVKKAMRDMTPTEMLRKGSWAVRFYGRRASPPLVDDAGRPTRFALSAAAWGEPVPKTAEAARQITEKGKRLLEAYERGKCRWAARTGIRTKRRAA